MPVSNNIEFLSIPYTAKNVIWPRENLYSLFVLLMSTIFFAWLWYVDIRIPHREPPLTVIFLSFFDNFSRAFCSPIFRLLTIAEMHFILNRFPALFNWKVFEKIEKFMVCMQSSYKTRMNYYCQFFCRGDHFVPYLCTKLDEIEKDALPQRV